MVEEGEPDPEFESILDIVDPNRWETSSVDELNIQCFCHGANINLFCSGMETCPCKSIWPSWSAEKRRTWNQARRSRALSVLSAPRTNLTSPRKNSTRYKISNPCHLQLVLNLWPQFHVRKMILITFCVYRTWQRNRQTTAFPIWSPTWTARAARCRQLSTLWNSRARSSSTDSPPPACQWPIGMRFPPFTRTHSQTAWIWIEILYST